LTTAWPAQPETAEPEDALEMGKQHLNALAIAAGLLEGLCAGERTGDIAGLFVDAAPDAGVGIGAHAKHISRFRINSIPTVMG
jgi:hypothetical protein